MRCGKAPANIFRHTLKHKYSVFGVSQVQTVSFGQMKSWWVFWRQLPFSNITQLIVSFFINRDLFHKTFVPKCPQQRLYLFKIGCNTLYENVPQRKALFLAFWRKHYLSSDGKPLFKKLLFFSAFIKKSTAWKTYLPPPSSQCVFMASLKLFLHFFMLIVPIRKFNKRQLLFFKCFYSNLNQI